MNAYIVKIDFNYVDNTRRIKESVSRKYLVETVENARYALDIAMGHMKINETNLSNTNLIRDIVNVESHLIKWIKMGTEENSARIKRIL